MNKENPICFFCKREVNINEEYYIIEGPEGNMIEVHNHNGVVENGGVKMFRGEPVKDDEDNS